MTNEQHARLVEIYGPDYEQLDIPPCLRDEATYEDEHFAERAEQDAQRAKEQ